jgi:hypothetical protein
LSCKVVLQGSPARLTCKVVLQGCPARFTCKVVLQGCPSRFTCKVVLQGCPARLSYKVYTQMIYVTDIKIQNNFSTPPIPILDKSLFYSDQLRSKNPDLQQISNEK